MKPILLIFLVIIPFSGFTQVNDDFSKPNFTIWRGDTVRFLHDQGWLRTNGEETSSVLQLAVKTDTTTLEEWQLSLDLRFAPSGSNQFRFYLSSDSLNLQNSANAVYLELGQTGEDNYNLFHKTLSGNELLISSKKSYTGDVLEDIKVIIQNDTCYFYLKNGESYLLDTLAYAPVENYGYTGLYCKHTTTRRDRFYFDNFYAGQKIEDLDPPKVVDVEVFNEKSLAIHFNEKINSYNEIILNELYPPSSSIIERNTLKLHFDQSFREIENSLLLNGIADAEGNILDTLISFFYLPVSIPEPGDILINEFMADPTPQIELPEAEYLELWNTSEKHFDLQDLLINEKPISGSEMILQAGTYAVVLPQKNKIEFEHYGNIIGMESWDILKNTGDEIVLTQSNGTVIDQVIYNSNWLMDERKGEGGYAMERIQKSFPCDAIYNWRYSIHEEGGTPGKSNSVANSIDDITPPNLDFAIGLDSGWVQLTFSEPLSPISIQLNNFVAEELNYTAIKFIDGNKILLQAETDLLESKNYRMTIKTVQDCYGNELFNKEVEIILPGKAESKELIFTEALFNPYPDGVDFIEIYNLSKKILNLQEIYLSRDSINLYELSGRPYLIFPGEYLAITKDTLSVKLYYNTGNLLQVAALPSMPNELGRMFLISDTSVIDNMTYHEDQHLKTLDDVEGVSLEKISLSSGSEDPSNWHSASATSGYGTPGFSNSQMWIGEEFEKNALLVSEYFTPNQDGDQDLLAIQYNFDRPGMVGTFSVYDPFGQEIIRLADNESLAIKGQMFWDGIDSSGNLVNSGHYIIIAEVYTVEGHLRTLKEKFAVIR